MLLEAFDLTDAAEDAVLAADLRREMAEVLRARQRAKEASDMYLEARELFRRSGATYWVSTIDELLANLPVTDVTASAPPPA